ncbi:MAG: FAD-binding oxidoreductase [Candidatus Methanomethylicia archaeon]
MKSIDNYCIKELKRAFGDRLILEEEKLKQYEEDQSYVKGRPSFAVIPESTEEIEMLVEIAKKNVIPLIPRGGGTSLSGGSVPIHGGIVVDLRRMNNIIEIDADNLQILVEPGIIYDDLNNLAAKYDLFLPPNPATGDQCTIGGMIGENAAGPRSYKYGPMKNWVLGLEVVTSVAGRIWVGSKTRKWVSGYNLVSLFVGSEGTLGIVTKVLLHLAPKPKRRIGITIAHDKLEDSGKTVIALTKIPIDISAIELMDKITINAINKIHGEKLPEGEALILLEIEGTSDKDIENKLEDLAFHLRDVGVNDEDVYVYYNVDEMWSKRKLAGESLEKLYGGRLDEDIVVPRSNLPKTIKEIKELSKILGVNIAIFGHAGDGHLHPSILVPKEIANTREIEHLKEELFKIAINNRGALSGEHGIGVAKKPYINLEMEETVIKIFKSIKRTLDPYNIMNPGKKV